MNKLRTYGGGPRYFKLDHCVVYEISDLDKGSVGVPATIPRKIMQLSGVKAAVLHH